MNDTLKVAGRIAQPAEAEGAVQCPASHPAECYAPGTQVVHASLVHGIVRQSAHLAALSAVTAERDMLLQERGDPAGSFEKCMQAMRDRDEHARTIDQLRAEVEMLRSDASPDGFVSAPLEPSLAMQNAGWNEMSSQGIDPEAVEIGPIYRAMIAAMAAKEA